MRRQFDLFQEDQEFLQNLGLKWETVNDNGLLWLIVHSYKLPIGYRQKEISLAIHIPLGYPRAQLDMVYFYPAISRSDNKGIRALATRNIDAKIWQRWSRHRTAKNPWREGVDNISTHFALIEYWLNREFEIIPYEIPA